MSTPSLNNHWEISNDDLVADEDFAEGVPDYSNYEGFDFYYQVQQVADRIFTIHQDRGVRGEFVFGFEANYEGELQSASVAIACTDRWSMYLYQWLDLKRLTDNREATGADQAYAIRDALMTAYAEVRTLAIEKELI